MGPLSSISRKLSAFACIAVIFCFTAPSIASPITSGNMSRGVGDDVAVDRLNSRLWLGLELTKGLTLAQVIELSASPGPFEGFKVAKEDDAQKYIDALLGLGTQCAQDTGICAVGDQLAPVEHILGENYFDYRQQYGFSIDFDIAMYLSESDRFSGAIQIFSDDVAEGDTLVKIDHWGDLKTADQMATVHTTGWLMYKDIELSSEIPEPNSITLLILGAFMISRFNKGRKLPNATSDSTVQPDSRSARWLL